MRDPCPACNKELSSGPGLTRRIVVFGVIRGVFSWCCPDCRATWSELPSTQVGSTTRSRPSA